MSRSHYLKHLALSMGTKLAMIALRLLRNVLLARILGPSERGLFALLSTLPDLISAATSDCRVRTPRRCTAARTLEISVPDRL